MPSSADRGEPLLAREPSNEHFLRVNSLQTLVSLRAIEQASLRRRWNGSIAAECCIASKVDKRGHQERFRMEHTRRHFLFAAARPPATFGDYDTFLAQVRAVRACKTMGTKLSA